MLALSNLCWDPSVFEISGALRHGASVCISTENERGHNLVGDIESAIQTACPDKGPVVVVDYFTASARRLLVAYFFAKGGGGSRSSGRPVAVVSQLRPDTQEYRGLQAQLRGMLPAYMVLSTIVTASKMPLLSADKADLDALRGAYETWSVAAEAAKHRESGNGCCSRPADAQRDQVEEHVGFSDWLPCGLDPGA